MMLGYKSLIKLLIFISSVIIIVNFFYFVKEQSLNQYADWLINYQGGFVRRGLIGEIFYQIHKIFSIRLDVVVFFFVSFFYLFFLRNFFIIVEKIKVNFINLLLIFNPLSFFYPVMDEKVSGRKDIIYFFFLSLVCLYLKKINYSWQKYFIILISIITIFSHTGFIFLVPFYLVFFIIINNKKKLIILLKDIFIIIITLTFGTLLIFQNQNISYENIQLICNSLSNFVRPDCANTGYISTLNWSVDYNLMLKEKLWMKKNYNLVYSIFFIVLFAPLLIALNYSYYKRKDKINILFITFVLLIFTFPLYYIGVDYGRYMHLTYISFILIYFTSLQEKILETKLPKFLNQKNFNPKIILLVIFLYGFTFTIPHCCANKPKFVYEKIFYNINKILD